MTGGIRRMNKIIINGRFLSHRVTGVERYAREILSELDKIVQPGNIEIAIPPEVKEIPTYHNIRVSHVGKLHNRMWEHYSFPIYVRKQKGLSLNLCNVAPLISPGIVCIHDVKIKATPQYFNKKFLLWYNLLYVNATKRAKVIITVSEFSKAEIVKYYHVKPEKIHVIANAWQHYVRIKYDDNALEKYGLENGKYFFSMCSLEPNKNLKWILEVAKQNPEQIFAVAGSANKIVFNKSENFNIPSNVRFIGYISDGEAKKLMQECKAFLFPTFYEGFGIPPLEAISVGTKWVVVSDTAVMHEIFGKGVTYINPSIAKFDTQFNGAEDEELFQIILNRYSWKKSALLLWELLQDI